MEFFGIVESNEEQCEYREDPEIPQDAPSCAANEVVQKFLEQKGGIEKCRPKMEERDGKPTLVCREEGDNAEGMYYYPSKIWQGQEWFIDPLDISEGKYKENGEYVNSSVGLHWSQLCVSRFEGTSCEEREQLFKAQRAWCPCRYEAEPLPCKVSDWKVAGKCTKVCGGGTLKKTREILRPALNGGACAVEMESDVSCNEHDCEEKFHTQDAKCPAPYNPMSKEQCEHRAHEHNPKAFKDLRSLRDHKLPAGCIYYTLQGVYLWNAVEQGVGHERFEGVCALETSPRKLTPESVYV